MAYPGIALVAMVGVGLGLALWYFLTDTPNIININETPHGNSGPPPPRRDSTTSSPTNSWEIPTETRRRRQRSNSKAKDDCAICTEPLGHLATTVKCGHLFHASCIKKWRETIQSQGGDAQSSVPCPLCRSAI